MSSADSRFERFMSHLDAVSGDLEPEFHRIDSTHEGLAPVHVVLYRDTPEPGMLTAITYGLSLADHAEWRLGKPELCLSVTSNDPAWALAVGYLAEQLRGTAPFRYGDTINFDDRPVADTEMTAFVVFTPAVLDREGFLGIDVGDELPINITGIYPIHDDERRYIHEHGLEAFWHLERDMYDPRRPSAVT
jgi:hypothetical protein